MPARPTRPTLFIVVALVLLVLFFLSRPSTRTLSINSAYYRDHFGSGPSLTSWLADEEARYANAVKDRQALIQKWGPTESKVDPYPSHGEFYTLWDFYIPAFQCPHRVQRIGTLGDGGKWVCGIDRVAKQDKCVIYSFGLNGESSFEASLLERAPGCEIWGYDYSVSSFGPEIESVPSLKRRSHFQPWALGGTDSHSDSDNPKYWTLQSLMKLNGHSFIDVLKIDIEGGEFDALTSFLASVKPATPFAQPVLPIGQMQLEIHARDGREPFDYFNAWWTSLEGAGFRPFWTEPNLVYVNLVRGVAPTLAEYSFINIRGDHALLNEKFNN